MVTVFANEIEFLPGVLSLVLKLGLYCNYDNPLASFGTLWAASPPPAVHLLPLLSVLLLAFSSPFPQSSLAALPALYWCLFWCLPGPSSDLISSIFSLGACANMCVCVCMCVFLRTINEYSELNKSWNLNKQSVLFVIAFQNVTHWAFSGLIWGQPHVSMPSETLRHDCHCYGYGMVRSTYLFQDIRQFCTI